MRSALTIALASIAALSGPIGPLGVLAASNKTIDDYDPIGVSDGAGNNITLPVPLRLQDDVEAGQTLKDKDTELRILCIGDSITVGSKSTHGNSYREELQRNLVQVDANKVVFAGTVMAGTMDDPYYAAWGGRTINYMSEHINASLAQNPNIVLIHAGTNDMGDRPTRSVDGNDPAEAADRLGALVDQVVDAVPNAIVLVAVIINTCVSPTERERTVIFQGLIPGVARERTERGHKVLAVDMSEELGDGVLDEDCLHPDDDGYVEIGKAWYNYLTQVPKGWIREPEGAALSRDGQNAVPVDDDDDGAVTVKGGLISLWGPVIVTAVAASRVGGW